MAELCRLYAPAKKEAELCRFCEGCSSRDPPRGQPAARPKCSWRARFERCGARFERRGEAKHHRRQPAHPSITQQVAMHPPPIIIVIITSTIIITTTTIIIIIVIISIIIIKT